MDVRVGARYRPDTDNHSFLFFSRVHVEAGFSLFFMHLTYTRNKIPARFVLETTPQLSARPPGGLVVAASLLFVLAG